MEKVASEIPDVDERMKSHCEFVRQWMAESADLLSWLKVAAGDDNVSSKPKDRELGNEDVVSQLDCKQFDGVETQLADVKTKLEALKGAWHLDNGGDSMTTSRTASTCYSAGSSYSRTSREIVDTDSEEQPAYVLTADGDFSH